jgi:tripartite-type tricarboxylate transporter receptor subunit TctC
MRMVKVIFSRRLVAAGTYALCTLCGVAAAQTAAYPTRPVRFVISSSIGSGVDIVGRVLAEEFVQQFGQQFVVDNRAGAGTNLGMEIVAKAAPDGYTLLLATPALAASVSLYRTLPFDPVRDFSPISQVASGLNAVCVTPSLPAKSLKELVALAKAKPGSINFASGGTGTSSYLAAELFKRVAGVDLTHVPYKGGGPAITGLMAGETAVMFSPFANCLPHAKAGRVRMIALTSTRRVPAMPDVPTPADAGFPAYDFESWYPMLAPAGTPRAIIERLHRGVVDVLRKPAVIARLHDLGYVPVGNRPEELAAYVKSEIAKLGKVIRDAGIVAN